MRIGEYVRAKFVELHDRGLITPDLLIELTTNPNYSFNFFGTNRRILINEDENPKDDKGYRRYYANELYCGGYQLSSQWVESQRDAFDSWLQDVGCYSAQPVYIAPAIPVVNTVSQSESIDGFRDAYFSFLSEMSTYSDYKFTDAYEMTDCFEDVILPYHFHQIGNSRNMWAHPEGFKETRENQGGYIEIGMITMKIVLRKMKQSNL